jgi:hypothetical protein
MSLTQQIGSDPASQPIKKTNPPFFLITIDTEGDDLWSAPREITTRNSKFLRRFQDLCEEFHFKPTYLVNYEMAMCPDFRALGRDILSRRTGEIGMHLHAWNAPPIGPLSDRDHTYLPFLIEYPDAAMRAKIAYQTKLLADVFGAQPTSHRAGRWALNSKYAELLIENGYRVDCSVTPGMSWRTEPIAPLGCNGTDYRSFPTHPYWLDPADISRPGTSKLLEVPMTVYRGTDWSRVRPRALRSVLSRLRPDSLWLRPTGQNISELLGIVRRVLAEGRSYAEFMLHSSELMPGGSPIFRTERHIEKLYSHLRRLFSMAAPHLTGATLQEYSEWYRTQP